MIPLVDLKKQYESIKSEIDNSIKDVLANTSFIGGKNVIEFETNFKKYIGVNYCISCANGTAQIDCSTCFKKMRNMHKQDACFTS